MKSSIRPSRPGSTKATPPAPVDKPPKPASGPATPPAPVDKPPKPEGPQKKTDKGADAGSLKNRVKAKLEEEKKRGRGRPAGSTSSRPRLEETEIEESAQIVTDLQLGLFSSLFGALWGDGSHGQNDRSILLPGHRAWIRHYAIRLPWWLMFLGSQLRYLGPRLRDERVTGGAMVALGLRKPPKVIETERSADGTHRAAVPSEERRG